MTLPPLIYETVVTTVDAGGRPHTAPMGVRYLPAGDAGAAGPDVWLQPFQPSTTLDNIVATGHAVLNTLCDVRVFAGCVTGRRDWPLVATQQVPGWRLQAALGHAELELCELQPDPQRPRLRLRMRHQASHGWFRGLNRAQAAVVEGAVLVSRLSMLPRQKIDRELAYLQIAIDKTAGPDEREAWGWLLQAVEAHHAAPH